MDFDAAFAEYYTLYRGQATNIPGINDPEYKIGMILANSAIKKWDRCDGIEWNELWTDFADTQQTSVSSSPTYPVKGMRKPPKKIVFMLDNQRIEWRVVGAQQADMMPSNSNFAYFTGTANKGHVLHLNGDLTSLSGWKINFTYLRTPTQITKGTSIVDMSDPTFMVQDMLASRFATSRNGFGVKLALSAANSALQNMKIDNNTGTYGNSDNLGLGGTGFGVSNAIAL